MSFVAKSIYGKCLGFCKLLEAGSRRASKGNDTSFEHLLLIIASVLQISSECRVCIYDGQTKYKWGMKLFFVNYLHLYSMVALPLFYCRRKSFVSGLDFQRWAQGPIEQVRRKKSSAVMTTKMFINSFQFVLVQYPNFAQFWLFRYRYLNIVVDELVDRD